MPVRTPLTDGARPAGAPPARGQGSRTIVDVRNWFDRGGAAYAHYRPDYPDTLARFLAGTVRDTRLALDVGCGSGQFTRALGAHFDAVVGVDPSPDQIAHAAAHPRVRYDVGSAERLDAADASANLVTAAQAAHWFDLPAFYAEVRRVAAPDAVVALVSYGVATLEPDIDDLFRSFHTDGIGAFWPPERALVDTGYAAIDFPFRPLPTPTLHIERRWSADAFLGYVSTWSATRRAREAGRDDLLTDFADALLARWGNPATPRTIMWPIAMRLGAVG